ncbi:MAG: glycosyltransferase family protein [Deltaproteobacteria bacterium]|nr:glycosyltransferase family protein [Deltaproteobacteria bacterium]
MSNEKPRIVATIECRMASTRLPGKVLKEIGGKSVLEILVERVKRVSKIDQVVLATTVNPLDGEIEKLGHRLGIGVYRGSEEDVLKRVLEAAEHFDATHIAELTGDNPLVDPEIIAQAIDTFLCNKVEYLHSRHVPGYPIGMDVQVFRVPALRKADQEGTLPEDREHVSWYFRRNPELFPAIYLQPPPALKWEELRLTLDENADFEVISAVYSALYPKKPDFNCSDIISFCRAHPHIAELNRKVKQKAISNV